MSHFAQRLLVPLAMILILTASHPASARDPPVAVVPDGDANAEYVAVSGTGNATSCRLMSTCYAVSGTGDALAVTTVSGTGNATSCTRYAYCIAASGTGESAGYWSASGTGNATGCPVRWGGIPCAAVSLTGDSATDYGVAVSATGNARGPNAVSGCAALTTLGRADLCNGSAADEEALALVLA